MTYNEYHQVLEAGVKAEDLVVFKYEDQGVATLEDGLYVLEEKLKDPKFVETMAKFVKASMKGWDDARANPADGVKAVLENDASGSQTEAHQATMIEEINKLTDTKFKVEQRLALDDGVRQHLDLCLNCRALAALRCRRAISAASWSSPISGCPSWCCHSTA